MKSIVALVAGLLVAGVAIPAESSAETLVRLLRLDATAAFSVRRAVRSTVIARGLGEGQLTCLDGITPPVFTAISVRHLNVLLTPEQQADWIAFMGTPTGKKISLRFDAQLAGAPLPEFSAEETKVWKSFMRAERGRADIMTGGLLSSEPIRNYLRTTAATTLKLCKESKESLQSRRPHVDSVDSTPRSKLTGSDGTWCATSVKTLAFLST